MWVNISTKIAPSAAYLSELCVSSSKMTDSALSVRQSHLISIVREIIGDVSEFNIQEEAERSEQIKSYDFDGHKSLMEKMRQNLGKQAKAQHPDSPRKRLSRRSSNQLHPTAKRDVRLAHRQQEEEKENRPITQCSQEQSAANRVGNRQALKEITSNSNQSTDTLVEFKLKQDINRPGFIQDKIFKTKKLAVSLNVTFDELKERVLNRLDNSYDKSRICLYIYDDVTLILYQYSMDGSWSHQSPLPSSASSTGATGISKM